MMNQLDNALPTYDSEIKIFSVQKLELDGPLAQRS